MLFVPSNLLSANTVTFFLCGILSGSSTEEALH